MSQRNLTARFTEIHPLPGRDLMPVVDGAGDLPPDRAVYLMTRDNILEGDTGASPAARVLGLGAAPPDNMRISVPADTAASFEAIVVAHEDRVWKLVRTFDDPATWTEPLRSPPRGVGRKRRSLPRATARRRMGAVRPDG